MQSLLLPAPCLNKTLFGLHSFDIDPARISVHLRPPSSLATPKGRLGDSVSVLPMSGIVPTGSQALYNTSTSYSPTTQTGQQPETEERSRNTNVPDLHPRTHPSLSSSSLGLSPLVPAESTGAVTAQIPRFLSTGSLPTTASSSTPTVTTASSGVSPLIAAGPLQLGLHGVSSSTTSAVRTLPPRSTRRAKAHVASACVNCKKKHLGCDSARPCRRCVLSGKASTCVDVTHKKRGRPPLKAEETALRATSSTLGTTATSREHYQPSANVRIPGGGHSRTASREIRPITDLQYPRALEQGSTSFASSTGPLSGSAGRWQPFTSPQSLSMSHPQQPLANSGMIANYGHGNLPPPPPPPPPLSYSSQVTAFPPQAGASEVPAIMNYMDLPRPPTSPPRASQQYAQQYPPTVQSRISPHAPSGSSDVSFGAMSREPYLESTVRLPPILPSPPTFAAHPHPHPSPYSHQRSDSYSSIFTYQGLGNSPPQQYQQHEPPPSAVDVASQQVHRLQESPRSMYELPAIPGVVSRVHERSPPNVGQQQQQQSAVVRRSTPDSPVRTERRRSAASEAEENPQPTKRRRMALDDIVND